MIFQLLIYANLIALGLYGLYTLAGAWDIWDCGGSFWKGFICSITRHKWEVHNTKRYGAAVCLRCGSTSHT